MAASAALSSSGSALCPSFAVVCSFLERYGAALDLPEMSFPQIEKYLRDTSTVPKPLVELHVKLLRKLGRSVSTDRWEKYLAKVCQELNSTWAWELEQRGYPEMSMECKSSILKYLCECQFDDNLKFKMAINEEEPETMRLQPIGRDRQGLMYWLQLDQEQNIRLYTEEQDDLDGSTWKCIVRSRNDLADALELLKAQVEPNQNLVQTGSRSSSPSQKDFDEDYRITEKQSDSKSVVTIKEEELLNQEVKQQQAQPVKQECTQVELKEKKQAGTEGPVPFFDNRVSTITTVKSECRQALQNTVSVVIAPGMAKQEMEQATVRSSQQAKIPLKKRELKLSENYHSNHLSCNTSSGIIVSNPSVIQTTNSQNTTTGQELTNGKASLVLPHKDGHNGVYLATVSHVGVIRSPQECHKLQSTVQELNSPNVDSHEQRDVRRQSVLIPKAPVQAHSAKINTESPTLSLISDKHDKVVGEDVDSPNETEKGKKTVKESVENISITCHLKDGDVEENVSTTNKSTLGKVCEQTQRFPDQEDYQVEVNGRLAAAKEKGMGRSSQEKQKPLEEASSELQKEGIRLKIKIPPHRRKSRGRSAKQQENEREQEALEDDRPLRRSARICRPSSKAAESQRKKPGRRKQLLLIPNRAEVEDEEEEELQNLTSKKLEHREGEPVGQSKKRRGKRRNRRPRWTMPRSKRHKLNEEANVEDKSRGQKHEESKRSDSEESTKEEVLYEDACTHCGLPNHPELILLCDSCDNGYHTACLRPPLMLIPDGEWFCPPCQHKLLCEKLEEQLQNLDSALKKKERAERRRERLVYVGISVENIIPEGGEVEEEKCLKRKDSKKSKNLGRRSTRTRKHISYRFDDFDDAIDEAIEEDFRDLCEGRSRRDLSAILDEGTDNQQPIRSQASSVRNKRKRRLNDLESDSTAAESEDDFLLSNSSEDEDFGGSGADDDEDEADSDVGSWDSGSRLKRAHRGRPRQYHSKPQHLARKHLKRRRRHSSEEEEEDTDEEMDSDAFSVMTDSDADKTRRGLRRGQRQQVNYCETSDSSDNSEVSAKKNKRKPGGRPHKEHLSSDYSDVSAFSRDSEEDYDEEDKEQRNRVKQRQYRRDEDEEQEGEGRIKRGQQRIVNRTYREVEEMGRGRRREVLSQQRRKRLAQMLKKRRPSTDEESEESESSSEEDRPIRKRLNRIDSDEDEQEQTVGRKTTKSCGGDEAQEKSRPWTCRGPAGNNRQSKHNGPSEPDQD